MTTLTTGVNWSHEPPTLESLNRLMRSLPPPLPQAILYVRDRSDLEFITSHVDAQREAFGLHGSLLDGIRVQFDDVLPAGQAILDERPGEFNADAIKIIRLYPDTSGPHAPASPCSPSLPEAHGERHGEETHQADAQGTEEAQAEG